MTKTMKKSFLVLFSLILLCSMMTLMFIADSNASARGADFVIPSDSDLVVVTKVESKVTQDITETKLVTNNTAGNEQVTGYVMEVKNVGTQVSIIAGYKNMDPTQGWGLQSVRGQAASAKAKGYGNVVAGINGDFYNMSTGEPIGVLVMNGVEHKAATHEPIFGIQKDGTPIILEASEYEDNKDNLKEAISGYGHLVRDGQPVYGGVGDNARAPRQAIGIKADGTIITYTADGRQYPYSIGPNHAEMSYTMVALGCVDAIALDGGGSATLLNKANGSDELLLRNSPSDGNERSVATTLLFISNRTADGEFASANIAPNGEVYVPNSVVELGVSGVDSSGAKANLPADVTLRLASDSAKFGTIAGSLSEGYTFTSNGTVCGEGESVIIEAVRDDKVVGSSEIFVDHIDSIAFLNDEMSLGFEKQSDMGLLVLSKNRDIHYSADDDLEWTITVDTAKSPDCTPENIGTIDNGILTTADGVTVEGTITVKHSYGAGDDLVEVTDSFHIIVGAQPTMVWNFEDEYDDFGELVTSAEDKYTFGSAYQGAEGPVSDATDVNFYIYNYNRGGKGGAQIVDKEHGEVKRGDYALKVDFDFSSVSGTEGACVGPTEKIEIPGSPTAIGVWVYGTPESQGYWLRLYANDANGGLLALNFTDPVTGVNYGADSDGITFLGWKYLEVSLEGKVAPYSLRAGETIRFMYVPTVIPNVGSLTGSIYFDDFQFVYGANTNDMVNPIIDDITVSSDDGSVRQEEVNNQTLTASKLIFNSTYQDDMEKYHSGIKNSATKIYIDGIDLTDKATNISTGTQQTGEIVLSVTLPNGEHSITIEIYDDYDNVVTETRYFTVDDADNTVTNKIWLDHEDEAIVGSQFELLIKSTNIDKVAEYNMTVVLPQQFSSYDVVASDGFAIVDEDYNPTNRELNIQLSGDGTVLATEELVAKIVFDIPVDEARDDIDLIYQVLTAQATYSDVSDLISFSSDRTAVDVTSTLDLDLDTMFFVGQAGAVIVKDSDGAVVEGTEIYLVGDTDTMLGSTDSEGKLVIDDFVDSVVDFTLYAKKDTAYSFELGCLSAGVKGNEDGTPIHIMQNATTDGSKSFSWFSHPLNSGATAQIRYATDTDYDVDDVSTFTVVDGSSFNYMFNSSSANSSYVTKINSVRLEELEEGVKYYYQVGDGTHWSNVKTFTTAIANASTEFVVLGDFQGEGTIDSLNNINKILQDMADSNTFNADFGIQVGDFVENSSQYLLWEEHLNPMLDGYMGDIDFVHVLGNHEGYGSGGYSEAQKIFDLSQGEDYYSTVQGNVYVAVINFSTDKDMLAKAFAWLIEDAKSSDAQWKVLAMHQPVYITNIDDSEFDYILENLPAVAQDAGIDLVLGGHQHAYSRTEALIDGETDPSGVYYAQVGVVGSKRYNATDNPEYHFEELLSGTDFTSIFVTITATDTELVYTAYDDMNQVDEDGKQKYREVDSFTITATECDHIWEREVDYYGNDLFVCTECGHTTHDISDHYGFVVDAESGKKMYYQGNTKLVDEELKLTEVDAFGRYYFDEDGLAFTGNRTVDGKELSYVDGILMSGYFMEFTVDMLSEQKYILNNEISTGFHLIDGDWYCFQVSLLDAGKNGVMLTGDNQKIGDYTYKFSDTGELLEGSFSSDGKSYGWAGEPVKGFYEVDDKVYYFGEDTYKVTGAQTIDDKSFTFDANGILVGHYGYFMVDGVEHYMNTPLQDAIAVLADETATEQEKYDAFDVIYDQFANMSAEEKADIQADTDKYDLTAYNSALEGDLGETNKDIDDADDKAEQLADEQDELAGNIQDKIDTPTVEKATPYLEKLSDSVNELTSQIESIQQQMTDLANNVNLTTIAQKLEQLVEIATETQAKLDNMAKEYDRLAGLGANAVEYKFVDESGKVLTSNIVNNGDRVTAELPEAPAKEADVQYTYTFDKWEGYTANMSATADVQFKACYTRVLNQYTVTFNGFDGNELKSEELDYGTAIVAPTAPTKAGNAQYSYTFDRWEGYSADMTVSGSIEFSPVFTRVLNQYTVTFNGFDGNELKSEELDYGTAIVAPTEGVEKEGYDFIGWYLEDTFVTALATDATVQGDIEIFAKYDIKEVETNIAVYIIIAVAVVAVIASVIVFGIVLPKRRRELEE